MTPARFLSADLFTSRTASEAGRIAKDFVQQLEAAASQNSFAESCKRDSVTCKRAEALFGRLVKTDGTLVCGEALTGHTARLRGVLEQLVTGKVAPQ